MANSTAQMQPTVVKAAFFDIDGTLLSFRTHQVSPGTVRAFDRLHAAGIRTFLSTGRPMVIVPSMPLQFDAFVTMNGALVFTPDRVLHRNPIPDADLQAWVDLVHERGYCTMAFTEAGMYCANLNDMARRVRDELEFPMPALVDVDVMRRLEVYQLIALMPPEQDADVLRRMPGCSLPRWHPQFTDIVSGSNSKAKGLEVICRHFGIEQSHTLAFGDGGNDIEMLRWAGIGVAMGNASPQVKAVADRVTLDVDHEGIEYAVDQILAAL